MVEGGGCDSGFGVAIGHCGRKGISEVYVSDFAYFGHCRFLDHFFEALSVIKKRGECTFVYIPPPYVDCYFRDAKEKTMAEMPPKTKARPVHIMMLKTPNKG